MGYDIHITRSKDWPESDSEPITFEDWQSCVAREPSVRQDPDNGPHNFLWHEHPGGPVPLRWWRGEVYSKNPDDPTMAKMLQLAESLGAYLVGDDGERYELNGDQVVRVAESSPDSAKPKQAGLWARLFGG